jgi:hypothetical protein
MGNNARWAILAFGMLLPFNAAIGLARRSRTVEPGKWMLEFAPANRAPQYVHLPEGKISLTLSWRLTKPEGRVDLPFLIFVTGCKEMR